MKILRIVALIALFQVLSGAVAAGTHLVVFHTGASHETAVTAEPGDGTKVHVPCPSCDVRLKTPSDAAATRVDVTPIVAVTVGTVWSLRPAEHRDFSFVLLRGPPAA